MKRASVEFLKNRSCIVRVHDGPDGHYGDPYTYCVTGEEIDEFTIELKGVLLPPTREEWIAISRALREVGYKKAVVTRIKNGTELKREIKLIW